MITTLPVVGSASLGASRRTLYRQSKRALTRLLTRRWKGRRWTLEPAIRRFLRARPRSFLARLLGDRGFALAAAVSLAATGTAGALPPIELSDVAAGIGGFVIIVTSRGTLDEFQRKKVYDDDDITDDAVGAELHRAPERDIAAMLSILVETRGVSDADAAEKRLLGLARDTEPLVQLAAAVALTNPPRAILPEHHGEFARALMACRRNQKGHTL